jgi:transcriptional regulator with XRE-family HTH domain
VPASDKLRDAISSKIVRLLKAERERQNLSLNRLSQLSGLSRQTIAYVENEVQSPSLDTLLRMALGLKVDLGKIISGAQNDVSPKRD